MNLNLPILDLLADRQTILVAGAGGGFDVFAGLPIYFTLREMGKQVHLANYSFTEVSIIEKIENVQTLIPERLVGVQGAVRMQLPYYPEGYLAQWFSEVQGEDVTVWMFAKVGAGPLIEAYARLVDHLNIDAVILVDGGVDSLMHGDEQRPGTWVEDTLSLISAEDLDIPVKVLACLGFGTESEVGHYHALENMAALMKAGGFLGSCALVRAMPAFQRYEEACLYVWGQPGHPKSHISPRVLAAVNGEFGPLRLDEDPSPVLVSPLMSLYWFFDVHTVLDHNLLASHLRTTQTTSEAFRVVAMYISMLDLRRRQNIPY